MLLEFLPRLQKELSITGQAIYETIIAIAERVNRKVEVLRLHSQASVAITQVDAAHTDLGRQITALWTRRFLPGHEAALTLQRELSRRSAGLERLPLPQGSLAIGQKVGDLRFPESVRVVTIFRG